MRVMRFFNGTLREKIRTKNAPGTSYPDRYPYRVEVFNPKTKNFYISGRSCNACVGVWQTRDVAQRVADVCNMIATAKMRNK